jgi:MFS family permease
MQKIRAGRELAVLYAVMILTRVGFGVIIIIFPSYIIHAGDITSAVIIAIYPLVEAIFALPAGRLCDITGRRFVFLACLALMTILVFALGLSRETTYVAIVHGMMGIAAAGITISSLTMITDLTHKRNRGAGMGGFDFTNIVGYAVGVLVGGRLEALFSSKLGDAFFITSFPLGIALLISAFVVKEPFHPSTKSIPLNPLAALDRNTKAILPIWLSLTALLGIVFYLPRALFLVGIGTSTTSLLLFAGVVAIGIGSVGFGSLSDRIGRKRVLLIGVVGLLGLLVSLALIAPHGAEAIIRNAYLIVPFGLATSALVPSVLAMVGDSASIEMRGTAMGLYGIMLSGGIALGTLVAGVAHSIGGLTAILYSGTIVFAGACILSYYLMFWQKN